MAATTKARREGGNTFKMLRENNLQPRILYIVKLPFKRKGSKNLLPREHGWKKLPDDIFQ